MWVVIFETGRVLAFVMFEAGRAINDGAIHPELLIPKAGHEPTPSCEDRILSPARLPFPWYRKHVAAALKLDETEKARLRKQALDWLCADLAARAKRLEGPTPRTSTNCSDIKVQEQKEVYGIPGLADRQRLHRGAASTPDTSVIQSS